MPQSYDYDEGSETWPFFMLTLLLTVLIPMTLMQIWKLTGKTETEDEKVLKVNNSKSVMNKLDDKYTDSSIVTFRDKYNNSINNVFSAKNGLIIVGWICVSVLIQIINSNESIAKSAMGTFDPYEILGVTVSSTEKEIKKAYRNLSLKFHPDKLDRNLSEKERLSMEEIFVQISKAYEALTNPATKENYLLYGHPDGPQSQIHGIALPSFLVNGSLMAKIVIFAYVSLLSIGLPYLVRNWWVKTRSYTKNNIHVETASYFVDRMINYKPSEILTVKLIVSWLSHSKEFRIYYPTLTAADFERLLLAHINREKVDKSERDIQYRIVAKCHTLINGLVAIACGFRNMDIASAALDTFKCIMQAVPDSKYSEILQLPNVNKDHFIENSEDIFTVGKLFTLDDKKIGKVLGISDEELLKDTLAVASNIPFLRLLKAEFKVPGEKNVITGSIPYISLKILVHSARQKVISEKKFPEKYLEDDEDFETIKDPYSNLQTIPLTTYSFSPYFPAKRRSDWVCLIGLQKDNKIIQTPVTIDRLSFKNLNNEFDKRLITEINDKNFNPEEWDIAKINIPLGQPAPNEKGTAFFKVVIKSADYFGPDLEFTMKMDVIDPPPFEEKEEIYEDDSEDNESGESDGEESEEESEDDNDSDYTDIDTDTEDEDEDN
ncbi:hypothetical protein TPHA_0G01480 [Tetrapisispora phaffii CBS 4417]|uniref:J domain-containing protein n=1 Tax=Tetrapisispora phaffii (strain ATCC 24235 / CBS 4417 / NBRC 1672 / NRRL Y-8282 / UCD 70-5) TaxID=1071381 RepID=G8BVQ7_TETPH|nr:hypothetical protein TPHA_0G01480 [Tetrapisispora phaffii CBS 4417]CCE63985.1 hypothetical protein TPHA_0G01480 [Tetrapisispora phaffii CBS 4417]